MSFLSDQDQCQNLLTVIARILPPPKLNESVSFSRRIKRIQVVMEALDDCSHDDDFLMSFFVSSSMTHSISW